MKPPRNRMKGFTLIEVMVAVVILAIGLLGMATLMIQSLQSSESAYSRSQATLLAYDIIDRMRSNRVLDASNPYQSYRVSQATISNDYVLVSPEACPDAAICSENCQGSDKAVNDLAEWCTALTATLPNVIAATAITRNGDNDYVVQIHWQEPTGDTGNVTLEAEL